MGTSRNEPHDVALVPIGSVKRRASGGTTALIALFLALAGLGTMNLYSASNGSEVFSTHLKHLFLGLVVFSFCGWVVRPKVLKMYAYWIFGLTCMLLLAVLVLGDVRGGSQRWLALGPLRFQPSELAKISVAIVVAHFFSVPRGTSTFRLRDLVPLAAMVGLMVGLIFPQPDFGTSGFLILITMAQIMMVRLDWRSLAIMGTACVSAAPVVWFFLLEEYQKFRIISFLNPDLDPQGKGYNALQSLIAIGSGGLTGKGYLAGTQTKLNFLPMSDTDFAFSVFAEEHGFIGSGLVILMFATVAYVAVNIGSRSKDTFCSLLAVGLAAFIFIEVTINVAMVLRMFPVKGLPLPFFSYGGSGLIVASAAFGLLVALDRNNVRNAAPK